MDGFPPRDPRRVVPAPERPRSARRKNDEEATSAPSTSRGSTDQGSQSKESTSEAQDQDEFSKIFKELLQKSYNEDVRNFLNDSMIKLAMTWRVPFVTTLQGVVAKCTIVIREVDRILALGEKEHKRTELKCYRGFLKEALRQFANQEATQSRKAEMKKGINYYTKKDHREVNEFFNGIQIALDKKGWGMWATGIKTIPEATLSLPLINEDFQKSLEQGGGTRKKMKILLVQILKKKKRNNPHS